MSHPYNLIWVQLHDIMIFENAGDGYHMVSLATLPGDSYCTGLVGFRFVSQPAGIPSSPPLFLMSI